MSEGTKLKIKKQKKKGEKKPSKSQFPCLIRKLLYSRRDGERWDNSHKERIRIHLLREGKLEVNCQLPQALSELHWYYSRCLICMV